MYINIYTTNIIIMAVLSPMSSSFEFSYITLLGLCPLHNIPLEAKVSTLP